jgi:hypothetical protein
MAPRAHRQHNCTVSSTLPLEPWPTPEPLPPAARAVEAPCCRAPPAASRRGAPVGPASGAATGLEPLTHLEGGDNGSNGLGGTRRGTLQARGAHRVGAAENLNISNGARVSISQAAGAPRTVAAAACAWYLRSKKWLQGAYPPSPRHAGRGRGAGGAAPRTRARARAVLPLARRAPQAPRHSPEWLQFPP